jgi:hypothetical protein
MSVARGYRMSETKTTKLTIEQALQDAKEWQHDVTQAWNFDGPWLSVLIEAVERMVPVVVAAEKWHGNDHVNNKIDLHRAIDRYCKGRGE